MRAHATFPRSNFVDIARQCAASIQRQSIGDGLDLETVHLSQRLTRLQMLNIRREQNRSVCSFFPDLFLCRRSTQTTVRFLSWARNVLSSHLPRLEQNERFPENLTDQLPHGRPDVQRSEREQNGDDQRPLRRQTHLRDLAVVVALKRRRSPAKRRGETLLLIAVMVTVMTAFYPSVHVYQKTDKSS